MKKIISLFLATILASSMLLTSCADKVEVNVDSDMLGKVETNNASTGGSTGETNTNTPEVPEVSPTLNVNNVSLSK